MRNKAIYAMFFVLILAMGIVIADSEWTRPIGSGGNITYNNNYTIFNGSDGVCVWTNNTNEVFIKPDYPKKVNITDEVYITTNALGFSGLHLWNKDSGNETYNVVSFGNDLTSAEDGMSAFIGYSSSTNLMSPNSLFNTVFNGDWWTYLANNSKKVSFMFQDDLGSGSGEGTVLALFNPLNIYKELIKVYAKIETDQNILMNASKNDDYGITIMNTNNGVGATSLIYFYNNDTDNMQGAIGTTSELGGLLLVSSKDMNLWNQNENKSFYFEMGEGDTSIIPMIVDKNGTYITSGVINAGVGALETYTVYQDLVQSNNANQMTLYVNNTVSNDESHRVLAGSVIVLDNNDIDSTHEFNGIQGAIFQASNFGNGTTYGATGVGSTVSTGYRSGNITNAVGFNSEITVGSLGGDGNIENAYGIRLYHDDLGGGSIKNYYAILLNNSETTGSEDTFFLLAQEDYVYNNSLRVWNGTDVLYIPLSVTPVYSGTGSSNGTGESIWTNNSDYVYLKEEYPQYVKLYDNLVIEKNESYTDKFRTIGLVVINKNETGFSGLALVTDGVSNRTNGTAFVGVAGSADNHNFYIENDMGGIAFLTPNDKDFRYFMPNDDWSNIEYKFKIGRNESEFYENMYIINNGSEGSALYFNTNTTGGLGGWYPLLADYVQFFKFYSNSGMTEIATAEDMRFHYLGTDMLRFVNNTLANFSINISAPNYLNGSGSKEWIRPENIADVDYEDICSGDSCPFAWNISGTNVILQENDWHVGIGTTNPVNELNVIGVANITKELITPTIEQVNLDKWYLGLSLNDQSEVDGVEDDELFLDSSFENNHVYFYNTVPAAGDFKYVHGKECFNGGGCIKLKRDSDSFYGGYLTEQTANGLPEFTNNFTMLIYFNSTNTSQAGSLITVGGGYNKFYLSSANGGQLRYTMATGTTPMSPSFVYGNTINLSDGNWHMGAVTIEYVGFNQSNATFYLDGKQDGSWIFNGTIQYVNTELRIGSDGTFVTYGGYLDNPNLWLRVLSAQEIENLWNTKWEAGEAYTSKADAYESSDGYYVITQPIKSPSLYDDYTEGMLVGYTMNDDDYLETELEGETIKILFDSSDQDRHCSLNADNTLLEPSDRGFRGTRALVFNNVTGDNKNYTTCETLEVSNDFTASCWIYPDSENGVINRRYTVFGIGDQEAHFYLGAGYGDLRFTAQDLLPATIDGETDQLEDYGEMFQVGIIRDGETTKLFINGKLELEATQAGSINFDSSDFTIGGTPSGNWNFNGTIDNCYAWNQAFENEFMWSLYSQQQEIPAKVSKKDVITTGGEDGVIIPSSLQIFGNLSVKRPYWNGYDNSTQSFENTANVQVINISNNNDFDNYGIYVVGNQNLTFSRTGDYLCILSPEFYQNTGNNKLIAFWFQKNGVDVAWSNSRYTMMNGQYTAPAIPFQFDIEDPETDNIRFMWYSDSTASQIISIHSLTAPDRPGVPGVILNCQKVSEIT